MDEKIPFEDSDETIDSSEEDEDQEQQQTAKDIQTVDECTERASRIEDKLSMISNVFRGLDKRMSYNLRLMGSVAWPTNKENDE